MSCQCSMIKKMVNELTQKYEEIETKINAFEPCETYWGEEDAKAYAPIQDFFQNILPEYGYLSNYLRNQLTFWSQPQIGTKTEDHKFIFEAKEKLQEAFEKIQEIAKCEEPQQLVDLYKECHQILYLAKIRFNSAKEHKGYFNLNGYRGNKSEYLVSRNIQIMRELREFSKILPSCLETLQQCGWLEEETEK